MCQCGMESESRIVGGVEVNPVSLNTLFLVQNMYKHLYNFLEEQVPLDGAGQPRRLPVWRLAGGLQVRGHGRPLPLLRHGGRTAHGAHRRDGNMSTYASVNMF